MTLAEFQNAVIGGLQEKIKFMNLDESKYNIFHNNVYETPTSFHAKIFIKTVHLKSFHLILLSFVCLYTVSDRVNISMIVLTPEETEKIGAMR